jgi:hypothetical protein
VTRLADKPYYIAFDIIDMPGLALATRVTLANEVLRDDIPARVGKLCEHPLYAKLATYVVNNPPKINKDI